MDDSNLPSTLHVDFDKTITQVIEDPDFDPYCKDDLHNVPVNQQMQSRLRSLTEQGHTVIVWTARPWSHAASVAGYLTRHHVPFEGLKMGKGGGGIYVDDKAVRPAEFLDESDHPVLMRERETQRGVNPEEVVDTAERTPFRVTD